MSDIAGDRRQHQQPGPGAVRQLLRAESNLQNQMGVAPLAAIATSDDVGELLADQRERRECDAAGWQRVDRRQGRRLESADDDRPVGLSTAVHRRTASVHHPAPGKLPQTSPTRLCITRFDFCSNSISHFSKSIRKSIRAPPRISSCQPGRTSKFQHRPPSDRSPPP